MFATPARGLALYWPALVVLAVGGALTATTSMRLADEADAAARGRLHVRSTQLADEVARRLVQAEYGLRGARAMMVANGGLDRLHFDAYVASRNLAREFPAVHGFGFIERIPRADVAAYQARARAEGVLDFTVHGAGNAPDLLVVRYVEPLDRNRPALGYDVGSDPARRQAAEEALRSGRLTLTPPLVLVQDERRGAGWLLYLPVYRAGAEPQSPEQRDRSLAGLLYAPITADEVLGPLRQFAHPNLEFRLTDTQAPGAGVLFDSRTGGPMHDAAQEGRFRETRQVPLAARVFALEVMSTPGFDRRVDAYASGFLAAAGSTLTLLLAVVLAQVLRARERAERQSAEARADLQRLARVVEGASSAVAELDAGLRVRWVNEGFADLVGRPAPECVGHPLGELLAPAGPDARLEHAAREALASARAVRLELTHLDAAGRTRWLDTELLPQTDARERARGFALIALDVTERKLTEQRLREREHLIGLMMENIPARISYWDRDARCRLANRLFAASIGRTPEALIGREIAGILEGEARAKATSLLRLALAGMPQRIESAPLGSPDSAGTLLVSVLPDQQQGEVAGVFVFAIDITQLKEAQREAERASAAKTQFLSNMSHELRTPMNAVLGMLQLLRMTNLGARQAEYVRTADSAARALLGILNDVLDFSKIEAGKMTLDPRPFTWRALLADLESILSASLAEKPLALRFVLDPALPEAVCGDDLRLKQVLLNLGSNAIKFTAAGEVVVEVRQVSRGTDDVEVEISVSDTGIGIPPADQQRIFAEFSQAAASTTRKYGGTGLGLSICSRLVRLMGGTLELSSEPGRGSRFEVRLSLPIAAAPAGERQPSRAAVGEALSAPASALRGLRVLVAEDNAINQQVARELLESAGAEVEIAGDGRQAMLAVAGRGPFDAVLMDVQMPVMDGLEATRRIRQMLRQDLPIIAVTANAMDADREAAREAGMDDHVGKPYSREELVACILRHVGRHAPGQEAAPGGELRVQPPSTDPVFTQRPQAIARLGGDENLHTRVLAAFFADLRRAREQIVGSALAAMTPEDRTRLFHSLKSTAATLGAEALADAAHRAEQAEREGDAAAARAALVQLREEIERALAAAEAGVEKAPGEG